jgi:hypothetical protein
MGCRYARLRGTSAAVRRSTAVSLDVPRGEVRAFLARPGAASRRRSASRQDWSGPIRDWSSSAGGWSRAKAAMSPRRPRRVGLMFQDYALFPHLSVRGECRLRAASAAKGRARIAGPRELARVGLTGPGRCLSAHIVRAVSSKGCARPHARARSGCRAHGRTLLRIGHGLAR